jgi:lipopolysaccharide export system protein LptA
MFHDNRRFDLRILISVVLCLVAASAMAQGTGVALGGFGYDRAQPVEITADSLDVSQTDGTAIFEGNVIIGQGDMRLSAGKVVVEYGETAEGKTEISRLLASGGVTLVSAEEEAEAQNAVYSVDDGSVTLSGQVLVTQGQMVIGGDRMVVNLETGDGSVEGNVRTLLNPEADQ